jgi:hypothetical protein
MTWRVALQLLCCVLSLVSVSALLDLKRYIHYWNLQFLNNVIIIILWMVTRDDFGYSFYFKFHFKYFIDKLKWIGQQTMPMFPDPYIILLSNFFCFKHTLWRLFQKRVVCTKSDLKLSRTSTKYWLPSTSWFDFGV